MKKSFKNPFLLIIVVAVMLFFFIFGLYPIIQVLLIAIRGDEGVSISSLFTSNLYVSSFLNSLQLGVITAICSTIVGFIFAFTITRTNIKGKKFFHMIALLPIFSPPFVLAVSIILLFGRNGMITNGLFGLENVNVYGLHSLVFIQTLAYFPLAYLNLRGVLESIDPALEDAALNMGASRWRVFRTITLSLSVPAVLSALLIVFIKSLEDLGNPMVLGGDYNTLAVQAYIQITGMYNLQSGALLAIALLLPTITAFFIQRYWVNKKSYITVTGKPTQGTIKLSEKYITIPLFSICMLFTGTILLFYGTVLLGAFVRTWGVDFTFTLDHFRYIFTLGFDAIRGSFTLSLIASPVTGILGMIIAYLLIRKEFLGKRLLELSTMLPFAVPGIVVGIGYILAFNEAPLALTGTGVILVIALVSRNVTVGIEAGTNSLRQVDKSIEEASTNLGASGLTTFNKIALPLMRPALFTGLVYSFVKSMTSISTIIFLVSVNWSLVTVSILSQIETGRLGAASAYVTILMLIIVAAMALLESLVNRNSRRRKAKT